MVDRVASSEETSQDDFPATAVGGFGIAVPPAGLASQVGLVAGTEDSTPLQFAVALDEASYLQLDDVVVTQRLLPGIGPILTSGIVTQVRARHEGASYGSDVFLISDGVLPARTQEIAEVSTTRVEPEIYVPPRPGEVVRRATGQERAQALYFDEMTNQVPVGRGRDGSPIYINMEFLDGTRGAHVSISGVSGVATKTSFALFLLHSIFRSGALGPRTVNAKALVFSVKGEDLLFLDQPNVRLDDQLRAAYAGLGLPAEPFASAGFWAPPIPDDTTGRPNVAGRTSGVEAFDGQGGGSDAETSPERTDCTRGRQWAALMQRTFGFDVLACPRCGGRLRLIALIEDAAIIRRVLDHLGLPADIPQPRPARAPPLHASPVPLAFP